MVTEQSDYAYPSGRIYAGQLTLRTLIQYAFNVQSFEVSGGPHWIDEDNYDVVALPPASSQSSGARPAAITEPPNDEQRKMLQTLLINRFGLKFRRELKESPVYVLMRGTKKLQMEDVRNKKEVPWMAVVLYRDGVNGGMAGENVDRATKPREN